MSQVTLDSGVLEVLLSRAASAAHLVSRIDDEVHGAIAVGPLADTIDEIVHTLTELLGAERQLDLPSGDNYIAPSSMA